MICRLSPITIWVISEVSFSGSQSEPNSIMHFSRDGWGWGQTGKAVERKQATDKDSHRGSECGTDREVRGLYGKEPEWVREGEEAVKCIDFFPPSFLKLIKVLAWFSDYPTAYRGFLLLKGSVHYLSSDSPPFPQMPTPPLIYTARGALLWNYKWEQQGRLSSEDVFQCTMSSESWLPLVILSFKRNSLEVGELYRVCVF